MHATVKRRKKGGKDEKENTQKKKEPTAQFPINFQTWVREPIPTLIDAAENTLHYERKLLCSGQPAQSQANRLSLCPGKVEWKHSRAF